MALTKVSPSMQSRDFESVTSLLADTVLAYAGTGTEKAVAGNTVVTRSEGFSYTVAASGATDQHVTTAGGVKLYVVAGDNGYYAAKAFGAIGDGAADDTSAIQTAIDATYPVKSGVFFEDGTYNISSSLVLPLTSGALGSRWAVTFIGTNDYDTSGPAGDITCKIVCTAVNLFVCSTPGTNADPAPVRVTLKNMGFDAGAGCDVGFNLLNLQYSTISQCWFRNFDTTIKGKLSVLSRVCNNTFLNCRLSAWDNTMLTGSQKSASDFWFNENYISGSIADNDTVLVNLFYPSFAWIDNNFVDFGVIGFKLESGESLSVSGNQLDYCPQAIVFKQSNYYTAQANRFTNIKKVNATTWTSPTAAMTANDWAAYTLLLGTKNIDISGSLFLASDKQIVMQQSSYSNIKERGSIIQGSTPGSIVDMTGRSVGASPDGEGLNFQSYEFQNYTTLPVAPATSYEGHKIYYYGSLVRNATNVWRDTGGGKNFGRTDEFLNGDLPNATGWTLTASETISGGVLTVTGNNFVTFFKTLSASKAAGTWLLIFDFPTYTSGSLRVLARNTGTTVSLSGFDYTLAGTKYFQFTAGSSFNEIAFTGSSLTTTMDNFFLVKLA